MYAIIPQQIPQGKRAEINEKILFAINSGKDMIPAESIYNCYTGIGGLHNLKQSDFASYHEYAEAKKEFEMGQFFTPHEVCRDMVDVLSPTSSEMILDMCCGMGNFFNHLPNQHNAYGFDIDSKAVEDGYVENKNPFKKVFTLSEKTVKRAIPLKFVRKLKDLDLSYSPSKSFARDMFLFSFYTRGMAFVDMAYLQKKNLKDNVLTYRRKKTGQLLSIRWEDCMENIVDQYSSLSSPFLLLIIKEPTGNTRKQYHNALTLINHNLKAIDKELGLTLPLTMYVARHSWASIARDEGIPISVISEGMGHDSESTTQIYLASLKRI